IEDVFDDDTDLPLPNVPLPNSGRGPLLQSVDDGFYSSPSSTYNPGAPSRPTPDPSFQMPPGMGNADLASLFAAAQRSEANIDTSKYKNWTCIYPIYLSARAPASVRRLPQRRCVKWPLSKDITTACSSLGLPVVHESLKKHPRDWENPGRVRVQLKDEKGRLLNAMVTSKGALLMLIAQRLQTMDPEN
ncbi:signal recognition particle, SRP19 subunit, partial [Cylindrobasidium torrendii FP15055 ss-10]